MPRKPVNKRTPKRSSCNLAINAALKKHKTGSVSSEETPNEETVEDQPPKLVPQTTLKESRITRHSKGKSESGDQRQCGFCEESFTDFVELCAHVREVHELDVSVSKIEFENEAEFQEWKKEREEEGHVKFVSSAKSASENPKIFGCNKTGNIVADKDSTVSYACTAFIYYDKHGNGSITVTACLDHYCQTESPTKLANASVDDTDQCSKIINTNKEDEEKEGTPPPKRRGRPSKAATLKKADQGSKSTGIDIKGDEIDNDQDDIEQAGETEDSGSRRSKRSSKAKNRFSPAAPYPVDRFPPSKPSGSATDKGSPYLKKPLHGGVRRLLSLLNDLTEDQCDQDLQLLVRANRKIARMIQEARIRANLGDVEHYQLGSLSEADGYAYGKLRTKPLKNPNVFAMRRGDRGIRGISEPDIPTIDSEDFPEDDVTRVRVAAKRSMECKEEGKHDRFESYPLAPGPPPARSWGKKVKEGTQKYKIGNADLKLRLKSVPDFPHMKGRKVIRKPKISEGEEEMGSFSPELMGSISPSQVSPTTPKMSRKINADKDARRCPKCCRLFNNTALMNWHVQNVDCENLKRPLRNEEDNDTFKKLRLSAKVKCERCSREFFGMGSLNYHQKNYCPGKQESGNESVLMEESGVREELDQSQQIDESWNKSLVMEDVETSQEREEEEEPQDEGNQEIWNGMTRKEMFSSFYAPEPSLSEATKRKRIRKTEKTKCKDCGKLFPTLRAASGHKENGLCSIRKVSSVYDIESKEQAQSCLRATPNVYVEPRNPNAIEIPAVAERTTCIDCGMKFVWQDAFYEHRKAKPAKEYEWEEFARVCGSCGDTFPSQGDLLEHIKSTHGCVLQTKSVGMRRSLTGPTRKQMDMNPRPPPSGFTSLSRKIMGDKLRRRHAVRVDDSGRIHDTDDETSMMVRVNETGLVHDHTGAPVVYEDGSMLMHGEENVHETEIHETVPVEQEVHDGQEPETIVYHQDAEGVLRDQNGQEIKGQIVTHNGQEMMIIHQDEGNILEAEDAAENLVEIEEGAYVTTTEQGNEIDVD